MDMVYFVCAIFAFFAVVGPVGFWVAAKLDRRYPQCTKQLATFDRADTHQRSPVQRKPR